MRDPSSRGSAHHAQDDAPGGAKGGVEDRPELLLAQRLRFLVEPEAKALLATWGLHPDVGCVRRRDVRIRRGVSGAAAGMSIVEGGASRMIDALAAVLSRGETRSAALVRRILTESGPASGVELESGERFEATHAVVASVTPPPVYRLLDHDAVPDRVRRAGSLAGSTTSWKPSAPPRATQGCLSPCTRAPRRRASRRSATAPAASSTPI